MTTQSSQPGYGRRLYRLTLYMSRNLFGCEVQPYTPKVGGAVGIARARRTPGPLGQGPGKRGGTDV